MNFNIMELIMLLDLMLKEIIIMFRKKYTNFTLYYVDSYTDTNTFLSNIYTNKDSTTALTNCSLIKLDYYFFSNLLHFNFR